MSKIYSHIISEVLYRQFSKTDVFEALQSAVTLAKGKNATDEDIWEFIKQDKKARRR